MSEELSLFGSQLGVSPFDGIKQSDGAREWWSARDLMPLLGYESYRRMADAVERAKCAAENQGQHVPTLFADAVKKSSGGRPAEDVHLTRYAAYLVAMNGDPRKPEIASAQSYFAIRTREAEVTEARALPRSQDQLVLEAMQILTARVEESTAKIAELEPKANAWSQFLASTGDVSVNEAAKALSRNSGRVIGEHKLRRLLESKRWIYRDAKRNPRAYQAQIDRGRLAERARTYEDQKTGERVHAAPQVRITSKGLDSIRDFLSEADR